MDLQAELRRPAAAHEAALRAVQKPPAKPWRGGAAAAPPPPPKVYRVEPREFRDLVQRLTGAPPAATGRGGVARQQHQQLAAAAQPQQPVAVRASSGNHHHQQQQKLYGSPWFSFPLAGVDGANAGGLM
ncbi:VQ motif-containing protein 29-like [Panicum miliaceum]|uniref:VQ motif-containing protein 29-like n=1 Tax=Panicum miliaceum TaxID=4540 RepID=A0A3L6SVM1_PANMI|nr:VQ motif-containing protein 29-like [Panicum miliaceum]